MSTVLNICVMPHKLFAAESDNSQVFALFLHDCITIWSTARSFATYYVMG